jgi:hypothetical protein
MERLLSLTFPLFLLDGLDKELQRTQPPTSECWMSLAEALSTLPRSFSLRLWSRPRNLHQGLPRTKLGYVFVVSSSLGFTTTTKTLFGLRVSLLGSSVTCSELQIVLRLSAAPWCEPSYTV